MSASIKSSNRQAHSARDSRFCFQRFWSIVRKEYKHVIRDPFVLMLALALPFLIVLILGSSIEFNLNNIATVVVDQDQSVASQRLIESFGSSNYFKIYRAASPERIFEEISAERAKAGIFIAPGFAKEVGLGYGGTIQLLVDGADNSSISAVMNYLGTMQVKALERINGYRAPNAEKVGISASVNAGGTQLKLAERFLFNEELNSKWFAIPGLAAVVIAIVAILLTTLTICKEWEHGSMELLMSTPVRSGELMLGKIVPYAVLSTIGFLIVYLVARLLFHVPVRGSHLALAIFTLLFIIDYLGIGLYVSVTTKEQQVAVQKALTIGLLPTSMLSGFIFPIKYMPDVLQYLTTIFPARWYVDAVRGVFLHGNTIWELKQQLLILSLQGIVILSAAIMQFKRSLE